MAEGLFRAVAGDKYNVFSAGVDPTTINPLAIKAMDEIGIDIHEQKSKNIKEFLGKMSIDYAIFVCSQAEEECPYIYTYALNKISWPFDDPAAAEGSEEEKIAKFRETRDLIKGRIQEWLDSQ